MEIIIGIVILVAIVLFIGGINNNSPVESWSDEKLQRMYGKLLHSAALASKANYSEKASELQKKADKVKEEIDKRQNNLTEKVIKSASSSSVSDLEKINIKIKSVFKEKKDILNKENITEEEFHESIMYKTIPVIDSLQEKYMQENLTQLEALDKAMETLLNYSSEEFLKLGMKP